MKQPPQVALIIETSVIYGRRLLAGVARYLRSHHRWSVFLEQHELGAPPPNWLTSSRWNGILSRPTDHAMARLFRRMNVPVVDLNDLHQDLNLPWVGSDHAAIGRMGAAHLLDEAFASSRSAALAMNFGPNNDWKASVPRSKARMPAFQFMRRRGADPIPYGGTRISSRLQNG